MGRWDEPFLRNRIFIGYQEKANALEIISYNSEAGRFEFQTVSNYDEDRRPTVNNIPRSYCTSCHQNQGPIFPRALWEETDFNRELVKRLTEARTEPGQVGSGQNIQPYLGSKVVNIDSATNHANVFSLFQLFWQGACESRDLSQEIRCRAGLFETMVQHRLQETNRLLPSSALVTEFLLPVSRHNIQRKWPNGISLLSADIDNQNPIRLGIQVHLDSAEALKKPRSATIKWNPDNLYRMIQGLGDFIPLSDIRRLDKLLYDAARQTTAAVSLDGVCTLKRIDERQVIFDKFDQSGDISVRCDFDQALGNGSFGFLGDLYISSGEASKVAAFTRMFLDSPRVIVAVNHSGGKVAEEQNGWSIQLTLLNSKHGLHARLPDGSMVDSINIYWQDGLLDSNKYYSQREVQGVATLTILPDPGVLMKAIEQMLSQADNGSLPLFLAAPIRAKLLMNALFSELEKLILAGPSIQTSLIHHTRRIARD